VALRRTLLRNRYHRRVVTVLAASLTASSSARAIGWLAGMTATEVLVADLMAEAAVGLMAAVFVARWFAALVPPTIVAALAVAMLPEHALAIASVFFPAVTVGVVTLWSRAARARERGERP
jgi:hypothetical protein